MIKKYSNEERMTILDYIEEDKLKYFYLYMDLLECGCEDEGLGLWALQDSDIRFIVYRYYDTLHLYGNPENIDEDVLSTIKKCEPRILYGSLDTIMKLREILYSGKGKIENNYIITTDKYLSEQDDDEIYEAKPEDVPNITQLMLKDDLYKKVYTYEKLASDLERRLDNGFGRIFVLRKNGKILAANATFAETEDMAVIGGLITDPEARGQGLGRTITASTWDRVKREGKQGLAFIETDNEQSVRLHQKMGYSFIAKNARIILK